MLNIFIPNKPHPNGCMFNSVADKNGLLLNLSLRRRIKEDIDTVLFNNRNFYIWNRQDYSSVPVCPPTDQVQNIYSYPPNSIVCVDSYYGSLKTVETLANAGVYCVCKCVASMYNFL